MRINKLTPFLLMLLFLLAFGSLVTGDLPLSTILKDKSTLLIAVEYLRLPRTLLAILTGLGLGFTGAALQGLLRNPLADPGLIGVSSGASFAAVLAVSFSVSISFIPFFGMLGAALSTLFLYYTTLHRKGILMLILVGLTMNSLLGAFTALTLNFSKNPYKSLEIIFWLFGAFDTQPLSMILLILPLLLIGFFLIYKSRKVLDVLSLGKDFCENMGYELPATQKKVIVGTALIVGPLVALGGIVGFVGLITPHILRHILKVKPSDLLLPSALLGSILCLLADISIRIIPVGSEIKIGVITSFLGAPFFLYLILTKKKAFEDYDTN